MRLIESLFIDRHAQRNSKIKLF